MLVLDSRWRSKAKVKAKAKGGLRLCCRVPRFGGLARDCPDWLGRVGWNLEQEQKQERQANGNGGGLSVSTSHDAAIKAARCNDPGPTNIKHL